MTKFIDYIIALFQKFSLWQQVFLVLIVGGLIFLGYNFVKNESFRRAVLKIKFFNLRILKINRIALLNHKLFFSQNLWTQLIGNVRFESEFKTKLFKIVLFEKSKSVITLSKEWVKKLDLSNMEDEALFDSMMQLVIEILNDYEINIPMKFKELVGLDYSEVFRIVYEQKGAFRDEHNYNVNHIQRNIHRIAFTTAFSIKQKVYSFLTQLEIATEMAITDCEVTFNMLNGCLEAFNPNNKN